MPHSRLTPFPKDTIMYIVKIGTCNMYTVGGKNKQKNKKGFVKQWTTSV